MTACDARPTAKGGRPCGKLGVAVLTAACKHEHIKTAPVCEFHHRLYSDPAALTCAECRYGAAPHVCRMNALDVTA